MLLNKRPIRKTPLGLLRHLKIKRALKVLTQTLLIGYDAVAVETIPANAQIVFFYDVPNTLRAVQERFPNAKLIGITTQGAVGPTWRLCDMETGDLTPNEAAQWAYQQIHGGSPDWLKPTIYCQAANGKAVLNACAAIGLKLGAFGDPTADVWWYMAWWNDVLNLVPPAPPWPVMPEPVGHQFVSYYGKYDMNVVLSDWVWLGPPPPPPTLKEIEVLFVRNPGPTPVNIVSANGVVTASIATGGICACDSGGAVNMGASWPNVVAAYAAANIPLPVVNDAALLKMFVDIAYKPYGVKS